MPPVTIPSPLARDSTAAAKESEGSEERSPPSSSSDIRRKMQAFMIATAPSSPTPPSPPPPCMEEKENKSFKTAWQGGKITGAQGSIPPSVLLGVAKYASAFDGKLQNYLYRNSDPHLYASLAPPPAWGQTKASETGRRDKHGSLRDSPRRGLDAVLRKRLRKRGGGGRRA